MMKSIALVLTLLVACKSGESEQTEPTAQNTSPPPSAPQARPTPRLPDHVGDDERAAARRQRIEGMRSHLDANGDGKLTVDELKAAQEQQGDRGGRRGRMMRFDDPAALDANKDGDISADELEAAMKARREEWQKRHDAGSGSGDGANATP